MFNLESLQNLKDKSADIQKKLTAITVEGKAGIEELTVTICMNGRHEATKVTIDQALLQQPIQIICDLIASAITDAAHKAETAIQKETLKLLQNLKLPNLNK
ncbi:MAG: YbaB/EbfC family nucleoid-associated protein [Coxiellaceae bacterium]|jgi:DNA-binding YbaB/EbfC family protein|nr:YbaB/EbfC family nucleoid-associated protein [Coxiellaceae bacterium]